MSSLLVSPVSLLLPGATLSPAAAGVPPQFLPALSKCHQLLRTPGHVVSSLVPESRGPGVSHAGDPFPLNPEPPADPRQPRRTRPSPSAHPRYAHPAAPPAPPHSLRQSDLALLPSTCQSLPSPWAPLSAPPHGPVAPLLAAAPAVTSRRVVPRLRSAAAAVTGWQEGAGGGSGADGLCSARLTDGPFTAAGGAMLKKFDKKDEESGEGRRAARGGRGGSREESWGGGPGRGRAAAVPAPLAAAALRSSVAALGRRSAFSSPQLSALAPLVSRGRPPAPPPPP